MDKKEGKAWRDIEKAVPLQPEYYHYGFSAFVYETISTFRDTYMHCLLPPQHGTLALRRRQTDSFNPNIHSRFKRIFRFSDQLPTIYL